MTDGLGLIRDAALAARDGRIAWLGPRDALPAHDAPVTDCGGAWILPGLVDCHTHLVFGGSRAAEFERRLAGATYEEIAREGGGILSTVRATRAADEAALLAAALLRLDGLLAEGVTTVEVKSGYGLEFEAERRMLRAARALGQARAVSVVTSFLGAHAVPPEYRGRQSEYAALAARFGALSADHLEHASAEGLAAMAAAGTVAVLLPGATYFIREERHPDIAEMRAAGLRMAVATDMNPGSSPARSLLLMLNMACTLYRLTVEEALLGVTRHAAAALGLADRGVLAPGMRCDLALFRIEAPAELCYWLGGNPCAGRVVAGRDA